MPVILKSYNYARSQENITVIYVLSYFFFSNAILSLSLLWWGMYISNISRMVVLVQCILKLRTTFCLWTKKLHWIHLLPWKIIFWPYGCFSSTKITEMAFISMINILKSLTVFKTMWIQYARRYSYTKNVNKTKIGNKTSIKISQNRKPCRSMLLFFLFHWNYIGLNVLHTLNSWVYCVLA